MKNPCHKPARCARCSALVIVWKRPGVKAGLLRKLALADHHQNLHAPRKFDRG